jgi:hypothetical protein
MFDPSMIGFAPIPYAQNIIGALVSPEEGTVNVSLQTSPLLNRILSPGKKDEALTFAIVFHGAEDERPLFESFPDELI